MSHRLIPQKLLKTAKGIPYSREHLWRLEQAGQFPRRVQIGAGRIVYIEDEIDAFIKAKIAERDAKFPTAWHAAVGRGA